MGTKTTTADLIEAIAATMQMPKTDVTRVLEGFKAVVTTSLNEGKPVTVSGLGVFKPTHREARTGRNPRTGDPVQISAANGAKFAPAKALKDALNV